MRGHWKGWAAAGAVLLGSAVLATQGCGTDTPPGAGPGGQDSGIEPGDATAGDSGEFDAGAALVDARDSCAADGAPIDCTGRCGPVRDPCSGAIQQCGGCAPVTGADGGVVEARVCDLATNTCIKPKVNCADLGAECGTARNSCGAYLDCPDSNPKGCPAGKECDPDTHKCRDCSNVSCKDLGYECGFAWLGCGQDTQANATDCGGCAASADGGAQVCNQVFHTCEPSCVPKSAAELCSAAKAKKGVECGIISNGCGGTVNCSTVPGFGCPSGQSCGVRGIANRCDAAQTPDECRALGRNCGEITSACDGQKIRCGDCPSGQVCNANGVCGAPCQPKTCAVDYAGFACGTFPDGCGSTVTCGSCPSGVCDQTTKTCCKTKTCAADYAGQCGAGLANGCGQTNLACTCASGACTADGGAAPAPASGSVGACCAPRTAASYTSVGQCGTNLPNGCGANNVSAACPAGQECVANSTGSPGPAPASGVVGSCCTRTDSCNLASGTCGVVQNSCRPAGTTYTCSKCVAPASCVSGTCCQPAPACTGNGGVGAECNVTKAPVDPGCGSSRTCSCTGGRVCMCGAKVCGAADGPGVCAAALSCSSAAYAGKCGTGLDNGVGGTINCGCPNGQICSTSTPGATGTCQCNNPTGAPYNCTNVPNGPSQPGGDACGTFNNGCGGTLTCGCPPGQTCNTAPNPNVCCAPAVCPAPALGSACGAVTNGCTTVSCACPSGPGNENFTCSGGTCACTPDTCRGRTGPQPDRCGRTLQCGG